jgi:hypothetical protein
MNRPVTENYFLHPEFICAAIKLTIYQPRSDRAWRSAYIAGSRRTSGGIIPSIHEKEK